MECYICNEGLAQGPKKNEKICALIPCGHVYHIACIQKWKVAGEANKTCPVCRRISTQTLEIFIGAGEDEMDEFSLNLLVDKLKMDLEKKEVDRQRMADEIKTINAKLARQTLLQAAQHAEDKRKIQSEKMQKDNLIRELENKLNQMQFKLSMYEEMFGKECSKKFDRLMVGGDGDVSLYE